MDIGHTIRRLLQTPLFTAVAIGTLAVGLGANLALYTVLRGTIQSTLPFSEPDGLVVLGSTWPQRAADFDSLSIAEIGDHAARNPLFTSVAAWNDAQRLTFVPPGGAPQILHTMWVTPSYFATLDAQAALGRTFTAADDVAASQPPVVVSHAFWRYRLGSDPSVVGRTLPLTGRSHSIIGVMPEGFRDVAERRAARPAVWLLVRHGEPFFGEGIMTARPPRQFLGLARLAPGVSLTAAQQQADGVALQLAGEHPGTNKDRGVRLRPLREFLYGELRQPLLALTASAAIVLLIGCGNLALLWLVRWRERASEVAVRLSLGAGSRRIFLLVLSEAAIVAAAGFAASVPVAYAGLQLLTWYAPVELPAFTLLSLDWRALGLSAGAAAGTALLFGCGPALFAARAHPQDALKGSSGRVRGGRRRLDLLIGLDVALSVLLLAGAALGLRSLHEYLGTTLGVEGTRLLSLDVSVQGRDYEDPVRLQKFLRAVRDELLQVPGVVSGGAWGPNRIGEADWHTYVTRADQDSTDPAQRVLAQQLLVSYGAFDALDVPVVEGRAFRDSDIDSAQSADGRPTLTGVLINRALADRLFPGESAVGREVRIGTMARPRVLGVMPDIRHRGRTDASGLGDVYFPFPMGGMNGRVFRRYLAFTVIVRHEPGRAPSAADLAAALARADPSVPIGAIHTVGELLDSDSRARSFATAVIALYAVFATALMAIGLFGVIAYAVRQRTAELALRLALGAERAGIARLVLSEGAIPVVLGGAAGFAAAIWSSRLGRHLLYTISPLDPVAYIAVLLTIAVVAAAAMAWPARRATRIDPASVLKG